MDKRARYLKRFYLFGALEEYEAPSLEIDVPSLEEINVDGCSNWYHDMNTDFPLLKSLSLFAVWLSRESFCFFSRNFPCLENLTFKRCYGFEEYELSSHSMKELEIMVEKPLKRAAIDVPSIVMFKYEGCGPESFSFTTNSEKWKSDITLGYDRLFDETSPRLGKVRQLLKAVSRSEISLDIRHLNISPHSVSSFMDNLFCICRPRIIQRSLVVYPKYSWNVNETTKFMCMFLRMEKGEFVSGPITRSHHWRQDLEKVTFETFDENGEKWHPILERSWSEFCEALLVEILPKDSKPVKRRRVRFRLTWRE